MPIIPPVESWQGAPYPPPPTTFESYPAAYISNYSALGKFFIQSLLIIIIFLFLDYLPTYATTPQQFHPHTVATPKYS